MVNNFSAMNRVRLDHSPVSQYKSATTLYGEAGLLLSFRTPEIDVMRLYQVFGLHRLAFCNEVSDKPTGGASLSKKQCDSEGQTPYSSRTQSNETVPLIHCPLMHCSACVPGCGCWVKTGSGGARQEVPFQQVEDEQQDHPVVHL